MSQAACPALGYKRSLRSVLSDPADRAHLTRIFFEKVRGQSPTTYYNLLMYLARDRADERVWRILAKLEQRIEADFGPGFVLANDFYSYRSPNVRMFGNWHQDGEFWLTADPQLPTTSCTGFNLWVLLDHHRMNYSFDVLDAHHSMPFYNACYASRFGNRARNLTSPGPLFSPSESMSRSQTGILGWLPPSARGAFRGRSTPRPANVPLESGDALVLKQIEIHRTDAHPLAADQWRLALGFKVLPKRPVCRRSFDDSPFGHDTHRVRRRWPGLLPEFTVGRDFPSVYDRASIAHLSVRENPLGVAMDAALTSAATPMGSFAFIVTIGMVLAVCAACHERKRARN